KVGLVLRDSVPFDRCACPNRLAWRRPGDGGVLLKRSQADSAKLAGTVRLPARPESSTPDGGNRRLQLAVRAFSRASASRLLESRIGADHDLRYGIVQLPSTG